MMKNPVENLSVKTGKTAGMGMDFYTVNCKFIDDYWHTRDRKPDYPGNQPASIKKHQ
jgi:hypothetical protein